MAKLPSVDYRRVNNRGENISDENSTSSGDRRDGKTLNGLYYRVFWVVILHFLFCIALAASIARGLDGYLAIYPGQPRVFHGRYKLQVSDVTTIISVALVVIKILVTAWTGTVVWNCVFVLLQSQGLELSEISRIMAFYIPPIPKHRASWVAIILLIFVVPQQFISPLLSGAVGWGPSFEYGAIMHVESNSPYANPNLWYWYGTHQQDVYTEQMHAAGFASLMWGADTPDRRHCRHLMNDNIVSTNSTVFNATIPCIQIHSITWPKDPPSQLVRNLTLDSKNISRVGENQLYGDWPGNAVIFNPSNMNFSIPAGDNQAQERPYPAPYLFSGEMTVIMLVLEQEGFNNCTRIPSNIFGMQPTYPTTLYTNDTGGLYEDCYSYAIVNFTAGVSTSPSSTYITSRVIEADQADQDMVIEPGPWVQEATYLMSDTMSMLSAMNTSTLETYNNRSGYVDKLVRYSYQASWDALYRDFDDRSQLLEIQPQEPRIRATVSKSRVFAWLGVCTLVLASSILLVMTQLEHKMRGLVLGGATAAFMTDPSQVLGDDRYDLTGLSYLTKKEKVGAGFKRLKLEPNERGGVKGYRLARA